MLRTYSVFNAEEIEGLPERFYPSNDPPAVLDPKMRVEEAEAFIKASGAKIVYGGDVACYVPSRDLVRLPKFQSFKDAPSYYGTAFHELVHWTKHEKRLDRKGGVIFGDPEYAFEELVAELGSAFLCVGMGITVETREDHAAYIQHWIRGLKKEPKVLFRAASEAQRAVRFLRHEEAEGQVEEAVQQAA